jgi:Putative Flp pilus-assembly TadE/G-like
MQHLKAQLRSEFGAVELIVAAGMLLFLILAALVIDIGNADQTGRGLQNAADAGALSGTQEINSISPTKVAYAADYALDTLKQPHVASSGCGGAPTGESPSGSTTCFRFSSNGAINGWVYVTSPVVPALQPYGCVGTCVQGSQEITVKACQTVNTTFARVINVTSERLCKSATGVLGSTLEPLALFASGASCSGNGLTFNSSNSNVAGVVWSNSTFTMTGSNNTLGPTFYVCAGGTGYPGGGNTYDGQSVPRQAASRPDPCANSPYPSQCDPTAIVCDITLAGTSPPDFTPIDGKVYCLNTNNNLNIILSNASYTDTFIVNRTNPGGSKVNFKCSGTCNVTSVPGTGGGFVIWNNAQATCSAELITNNGPGTLDLDGTIYAPNGKINLNLGTNGTNNAFLNGCTLAVNGTVNGTGPGVPVTNGSSNLIR